MTTSDHPAIVVGGDFLRELRNQGRRTITTDAYRTLNVELSDVKVVRLTVVYDGCGEDGLETRVFHVGRWKAHRTPRRAAIIE